AASARAVELPMPIGLPQPVISATRVGWGMVSSLAYANRFCPHPNPPPLAGEGTKKRCDPTWKLLPPPLAGEGRVGVKPAGCPSAACGASGGGSRDRRRR